MMIRVNRVSCGIAAIGLVLMSASAAGVSVPLQRGLDVVMAAFWIAVGALLQRLDQRNGSKGVE